MKRRVLSRRALLRGAGAMVALPLLDAMAPAFAERDRRCAAAPRRLVFVYVPNGIIMDDWTPTTDGDALTATSILAPLAGQLDHCQLLTGLAHANGEALADGPGDHARAAATFLTGARPKKTDGADIFNGVSVDQVAAAAIGDATRLASLELGAENSRLAGNCDSGYSCAYSYNLAWRTPTSPLPPETNPRAVFERLFGRDAGGDPAQAARQRRQDRSILDLVLDDARDLRRELGAGDQRKLDEYLYSIRDVEKRVRNDERERGDALPPLAKPAGIPVEFSEHVRLMFDLLAVALEADLTRVATFMMAREGSNLTYPEIGVDEAHHGLSHHRGDRAKIAALAKINTFHVEQFAYFLRKLRSIEERSAPLLDQTMVVYGSGLADGNDHTHHDLPLILAGGAAVGLRPGRHVRYASQTPMANLFVSLLDLIGVDRESFGDSRGELDGLGLG